VNVIETFLLPVGRESQKFIFAFGRLATQENATTQSVAWSAAHGVQRNLLLGKKGGNELGRKKENEALRDGSLKNQSVPRRTNHCCFMLQKEGRQVSFL
jgi:hypothetical protein